jgi:hypothetical protein
VQPVQLPQSNPRSSAMWGVKPTESPSSSTNSSPQPRIVQPQPTSQPTRPVQQTQATTQPVNRNQGTQPSQPVRNFTPTGQPSPQSQPVSRTLSKSGSQQKKGSEKKTWNPFAKKKTKKEGKVLTHTRIAPHIM